MCTKVQRQFSFEGVKLREILCGLSVPSQSSHSYPLVYTEFRNSPPLNFEALMIPFTRGF